MFRILIFLILNNLIFCQNTCTIDKIEIPVYPSRIILRYQCTSLIDFSPNIPIDIGSIPTEYNELDLSPNLFTAVPYNDICQFKNIYILDLSYNRLTNMTNAFKTLACLTSLFDLDLSYNQITTPILGTDFDDNFAGRLRTLNLNNNKIQVVSTAAFIRDDGYSRFSNLQNLNLANNQIKTLDLLWPLSIQTFNLKVDLRNNSIDNNFSNELNKKFDEVIFVPMIGLRAIDLTGNQINRLDDTNLLQYGMRSANEFSVFLFKLSNYNFGYNRTNFNCICPTTGLYTVYWYKNFSSSLSDKSTAIHNLFCSGTGRNNIFNFPCTFVGTSSTTTTTTTRRTTTTTRVTTTTTTTTTTITTTTTTTPATVSSNNRVPGLITVTTVLNQTTNSSVLINLIGQLINGNGTDTTTVEEPTIQQQYSLFLLLLLLIPISLALVLLFLFLCGRYCSLFFFNVCSTRCCLCIRPDQKLSKILKTYDLALCFNEQDEVWLEKNFIPQLFQINPKFTTHKFTKLANIEIPAERSDLIKSSRRVVLFFTNKFLAEEWSNNSLKELIREIITNDPNCVILAICIGNITKKEIKLKLKEIQFSQNSKFIAKLKLKLYDRVRYNCGLTRVEYLDYNDFEFWNKFSYTMPLNEVLYKPSDRMQNPAYEKIKNELSNEPNDGSVYVENELPLITKIKKAVDDTKTKAVKVIDSKKVFPTENENKNEENRLVLNDENFWESFFKNPGYDYEPVGEAGSSISGNKESNTRRFGHTISTRNELKAIKSNFRRSSLNLDLSSLQDNGLSSGRVLVPKSLVENSLNSARKENNSTREQEQEKEDKKNVTGKSDESDISENEIKNEKATQKEDEKDKKILEPEEAPIVKPKKRVVIQTELNSEAHYQVEYSEEELKRKKKKKSKNKKKKDKAKDSSADQKN